MEKTAELLKALLQNDCRGWFKACKADILQCVAATGKYFETHKMGIQ
jgi:hypothetical protein